MKGERRKHVVISWAALKIFECFVFFLLFSPSLFMFRLVVWVTMFKLKLLLTNIFVSLAAGKGNSKEFTPKNENNTIKFPFYGC